MSEGRIERRLAAILAADVAGYSSLMGEDEEGTLAALRAVRRELGDPKIAEHRGRIVKTTGDGLLAEFASVVDAVRCAVELQREMIARNAAAPAQRRIEFRMGINVGDIIVEDGDIFGDGVNIAARLEALAEPGGICVSRVVRDQVRDKLDFSFEDMGEQHVKNIARPIRVHRILLGQRSGPSESATRTSAKPSLALPDKPSIAVLAFENMSGDTHLLSCGARCTALRHGLLNRDGAFDGIDRADEIGDDAVAGAPKDATMMGRNELVENGATRGQPA